MIFLNTIQTFFSKNKINILYLLSFIAVFFMLGDNAWASDTTTKDPSTEEQVLSFLHGFMGVIAGLLGFMSLLVQVFLNPEWTSGSFIGLDVQLKTMWIMISNVVYFVFALLFVWIALMNIVGNDGDNYKLKQAIPKFIVGVLIVPFSWFFVQFVISVSSVLTVAVLSLPYNEFQNLKILEKEIPYCEPGYTIDLSKTGSGIVTCNSESGKSAPMTIGKITENGKSIFGIMTLYTYGVMNVEKIGQLYTTEVTNNQIKSLFDLSLKLIFDIIFIFAYLLLMIALVMALITRGFMLWMYTLFSPVFGLLYFFGKAGEGFGEGGSKSFNIKEFIALALIPFYVSIALVFGFIFLVTASEGFGKTVGNSNKEALLQFTASGMTTQGYTIKGDFGTSNKDAQANLQAGTGLFAGFASSLGTMLLQLLGIAVLWMAVMAALKQSEITKGVVEPIASFGDSIGQLIKSAPKYAPILPAPGGGMMGVGQLANAGQSFKGAIESEYSAKGSRMGQAAARAFGFGDDIGGKLDELISATYSNHDDMNRAFTTALGAIDANEFATNSNYRNKVGDLIKKFGADDTLVSQVKTSKNIHQFDDIMKNSESKWTTPEGKNFYSKHLQPTPDNYVESLFKGNSATATAEGATTTGTTGATTTIPSGMVRKNLNTITINHFSGKEGEAGVDISLTDDGIVTTPVDKLVETFVKLDYKGKKDEPSFVTMLKTNGINNKYDIENIMTAIKKSDSTFFDIPKT